MQFKTVQDFVTFVQSELDNNRLTLPTLPDIALQVRSAVSQGEASAQSLSDMIATDAALSARLIQVANSPLYRGKVEITNLQMAVSRLGNNTIRTIVTSLVMQQMFAPKSKQLEEHFRNSWQQSVNVAAISRAIASFASHLDPDQALLAGLIHQIGKLPILMLVEDVPEFIESPSRLNKLLEKAHPAIGKIIMESWDFPETLKRVPVDYVEFSRDPSPEADYIDVVQTAFLENIAGTDHPATRIDRNTVAAFAKLGIDTSEEILEIGGVAEEVELTHQIFT
ncbi:MAG: HDOD domain-containing protein [Methylococcaceae bacterium]